MSYQLALFGHPVEHSLSPHIHQQFARQFELDIEYRLIDVESRDLNQQVTEFFTAGGHGANVTVPHKQRVICLTNQLSKRAQRTGAVNTLMLTKEGLTGDNTDGIGLINDLADKDIHIANKRLLIIGAGGAVQGILPHLIDSQPSSIHITNRTQKKAVDLVTGLARCQVLDPDHNEPAFDIIINGTSLGHHGQIPPLNPTWFSDSTLAYDLSYGQAAEGFLNASRKLGAQQVHDGLGMLYQQAAEAFALWFGHNPEVLINDAHIK